MADWFSRTLQLVGIASLLVGCADGGEPGALSGDGAASLELSRLPAESKVYFRSAVVIPARTGQVLLASEPGTSGVATRLVLPPVEVDRIISRSTPLLVDRVESTGTAGARGPCRTTLYLVTTGGASMQYRVERSDTTLPCAPPTVRDIADSALVVPSPPVPIQ